LFGDIGRKQLYSAIYSFHAYRSNTSIWCVSPVLHLLPIRLLFQGSLALVALAVAAAFYSGWLDPSDGAHNVAFFLRVSSTLAIALSGIVIAAWRWIPQLQRYIFPYLGGRWTGVVRFPEPGGEGQRLVTMDVKHTLFGLKLLLDSKESTSWTLSVQADRNPDFERFRLFYIYLNERKEGVPGARERYRGVAIMRIEAGNTLKLFGDYFTETDRHGRMELSARQLHPWWMIWR
jgi:SMODS-associating 2TM, beta-strand rich effector domain